jgi:hypothetical protein
LITHLGAQTTRPLRLVGTALQEAAQRFHVSIARLRAAAGAVDRLITLSRLNAHMPAAKKQQQPLAAAKKM